MKPPSLGEGVRAVPRLCIIYPGIFLTTEEKSRKTVSQVTEGRSVMREVHLAPGPSMTPLYFTVITTNARETGV